MLTNIVISKKLVFINSASSVVTRVTNITVLIWLQQYLLKRITTEEYAIYPVVMALMMLVPLFTMFLTSGIGRFITESYAQNDEKRVTSIATTMFILLSGASLLILFLGGFAVWKIDRLIDVLPDRVTDAQIMMGLMVLLTALQLLFSVFNVGFFVRQKFLMQNVIELGLQLLRLILLFTFLFGISTRVLWVVLANVISGIVQLGIIFVISKKLVPALRIQFNTVDWSIARKIITFNSWNLLASLGGYLRMTLNPLMLNQLATPLDVTCYHIGSLPLKHIYAFGENVTSSLSPVLIAMHATNEHHRLRKNFIRLGKYGLWIVMFIATPLMVNHKVLVCLYLGNKFSVVGIVMFLQLAFLPISYGRFMLPKIAYASNRIRSLALRTSVLNILILIGNLYWVHKGYGAFGMALSTFFIALTCEIVLIWPLINNILGIKIIEWLKKTVIVGLLPAIASASAMIVLNLFIVINNWSTFFACISIGSVNYMIFVFLCIDDYDRNIAVKMLKSLKGLIAREYYSEKIR